VKLERLDDPAAFLGVSTTALRSPDLYPDYRAWFS
jgi:hypothetical protein